MVDIMKRKKQSRKKGSNRTFGLAKGGTVVILMLLIISVGVVGLIGPGMTETVEADEDFAGGSGTEDDPYQIENWHHLDNIRNNMESHFVLENDLDENTEGYDDVHDDTYGFQPIGASDDGSELYERFAGTFDGQYNEIADLSFENMEGWSNLFAAMEEDDEVAHERVEIKNIRFRNSYTETNAGAGVVTGTLRGLVKNIEVVDSEIISQTASIVVDVSSSDDSNNEIRDVRVENIDIDPSEGGEDKRFGGVLRYQRNADVENVYVNSINLINAEWHDFDYAGGIIGNEDPGETWDFSIDSSFYHEDLPDCHYDGDGSESKTESELESYSTYDDAGWDITTVDEGEIDTDYTWNIEDGEDTPFLSQFGSTDDDDPIITDPDDYDSWTDWLMSNPLIIVLGLIFIIMIWRTTSSDD